MQRTSHRRRLRAVLAVLAGTLLVPTMALAVPASVLVEGAFLSTGGGPAADGVYKLAFALYPAATGGSAVWTEPTLPVQVANGAFVHSLGVTKPIQPAVLAAQSLWIGVAVEGEPEMARKPLHAVLVAVRAAVAEGVDCSGCIGAAQLDKGLFAGLAKTSELHKIAVTGAYTDLNGAPDLSGIVKTGDLKDVAFTGLYKDVAGKPEFAKLGTACGSGLVVKGLKADGTLECVASVDPAALPVPTLESVSGTLLTTKFADTFSSTTVPVPIPDDNPSGLSNVIVVPDFGIAEGIEVALDLENSDLTSVTVKLHDPNKVEHLLFKGEKGTALKASWPPTKLLAGDLGVWVGKNPAGKWTLQVVDGGAKPAATDGKLNNWSLTIKTASTKKVGVQGGFQFQVANTPPVACDTWHFGLTYANPKDKALYVCNGKDYYPITLSAVGTPDNPGKSCKDIMAKMPGVKSGVYWISAAGTLQVYCNMEDYGGGWTLALRAGQGFDLTAGNLPIGVGTPPTTNTKPGDGTLQKLSDDTINAIRTNAGAAVGYWVTTPGDGIGKYGAEIFHRSDCTFKMQQNASQVKATTCNQWTGKYAEAATWKNGSHWNDNDTPGYAWAFGYLNDGQCHPEGDGLGVHTQPHAAFHRGWCGTGTWGLVYVR